MTQTILEPQFDTKKLRAALGQFPTGVCVITAQTDAGEDLGMTMSSFNSLSLTPPLILFSIDKRANSLDAWLGAKGYAVNVLSEGQADVSGRFARPLSNKWDGIGFDRGYARAPILRGVAAHFECAAHTTHDAGDHVLFIAQVQEFQFFRERRPLIFCKGQYGALKPSETAA